MPINKPTKPDNEFLPNGFGTASGVIKNDFSDTKKLNGFSANIEDILQGDNLNYALDTIGKQLKYLTTVVDYINSMTINQLLYVDTNNQLNSGTIHTFLPSQSGNNGKFLTTNGNNRLSWSDNITDIGDPIFTLNFNKVLPENCVWLEGAVKPTTGDFANLFAIYGYQYDTSYTGTSNFRLPNFLNRSIWGGTTAGYIEAGLPNITGHFHGAGQFAFNQQGNAFYKRGTGTQVANNGEKDNDYGFNASRSNSIYGNSDTVQPPVIKVRVYTRYKQ